MTEKPVSVAEQMKARARKIHPFEFVFESQSGTVGIRVPTAEESIEARLQAARDVTKMAGPDVPIDDETIRVDRQTLLVLAHACRDPKDPDGMPLFGSADFMASWLKAHEIVKLLDFLNEATAREQGVERVELDSDLVDHTMLTLAHCEREQVVDVLNGWSRQQLMDLAWSFAVICDADFILEEPSES